VYSIGAIGFLPLQAALALPRLKYKLYTGNHTSAEAFPLARKPHARLSPALLQAFVTRWLPGRLTSLVTERCYCRTTGCGEIASRYYGVQPNKVRVVPLGIDTDFFFPVASDSLRHERESLRGELGFSRDDIVCINTGRMVATKELSLLVDAITRLRAKGLPFRGLFIGDGPERTRLAAANSCVVLPFVPFKQLATYYRASDIAVWPAGESTSMFDATACGLPLIVSDAIDAHLNGNGLAFRAHDLDALVAALAEFSDPARRASAGRAGAQQIREQLDCRHAAAVRMHDFCQALGENV
jgi:glycosyltransferase involved in cell wall biosynthesis